MANRDDVIIDNVDSESSASSPNSYSNQQSFCIIKSHKRLCEDTTSLKEDTITSPNENKHDSRISVSSGPSLTIQQLDLQPEFIHPIYRTCNNLGQLTNLFKIKKQICLIQGRNYIDTIGVR